MTKFFIIEKHQFAKLQELDKAATYIYQRAKITDYIYDDLEAKLSLRSSTKIAQIIRRIVYLASDRGYSFPGREKLAEQFNASTRTVDQAIRLLKESGIVDIFYRSNPKSNSAKTCVFVFKTHSNYPAIKRILKNLFEEKFEEEISRRLTESKDKPVRKIATLLLRKKQDLQLNKRLHNMSKIIEYLTVKIEEAQQRTPGGIIALSSYIDKVIASKLDTARSQRQEPVLQGIPVFNWLNT